MSSTLSNFGFFYYVLFKDDYNCYSWIFPIRAKSKVFLHFESLYNMVNNIFNSSIKFLQTTGDMEYFIHSFKTFCHNHGMVHRVSCPHTNILFIHLKPSFHRGMTHLILLL